MRFIADNEIPTAVGCSKFLLHILIAGEFVQPGDNKIVFQKPVACTGGFKLIISENIEGKLKAAIQLVLPRLPALPCPPGR
jgi:hypothetical protein